MEIPFRPEFEPLLRDGRKTATTRRHAYGKRGDRFTAYGMEFELVSVERVHLWVVAASYWKEEGLASPQEFVDIWQTIHPRAGFQGESMVYLHRFRRVG